MSTPFSGDRSWLFAYVFYESLPSPWRTFFIIIILKAGKFGSRKTQISQKMQKKKKEIWRKKQEQKQIIR